MRALRRLARLARRVVHPPPPDGELTLEQLATALDGAATTHDVRRLIARVRPAGPHIWPTVSRHAPALDTDLLHRLLDEDPASAPELARNANLGHAEYEALAAWAAAELAHESETGETPAYLAFAPLTLERLADDGNLTIGSRAARILISLGRLTVDARRTRCDREARRLLLRIKHLSTSDLLLLTDVCRSDEEALLTIARHPGADINVWRAIVIATPRPSTVERLAELPGIRTDPELRQLLRRRYAESPALLIALASATEGDEFRELWLDLVHADRTRAAHLLPDLSVDQLRYLMRNDFGPLLNSDDTAVRAAALNALRRLGHDIPPDGVWEEEGGEGEERKAG